MSASFGQKVLLFFIIGILFAMAGIFVYKTGIFSSTPELSSSQADQFALVKVRQLEFPRVIQETYIDIKQLPPELAIFIIGEEQNSWAKKIVYADDRTGYAVLYQSNIALAVGHSITTSRIVQKTWQILAASRAQHYSFIEIQNQTSQVRISRSAEDGQEERTHRVIIEVIAR